MTVVRGAGGPGLQAGDLQVADAEGKARRCAGEIARLAELIEVRSARATKASQLVQLLEGWIRAGRPSGTTMVDLADLDAATLLKKGESIPAAIARRENRRREHDADVNRARSALLPTSETKLSMQAQRHLLMLVDRMLDYWSTRPANSLAGKQAAPGSARPSDDEG